MGQSLETVINNKMESMGTVSDLNSDVQVNQPGDTYKTVHFTLEFKNMDTRQVINVLYEQILPLLPEDSVNVRGFEIHRW